MRYVLSFKYLKQKLDIKGDIEHVGIRFNEEDFCLVIETVKE